MPSPLASAYDRMRWNMDFVAGDQWQATAHRPAPAPAPV
jgi:hypothetical protein